MTVSSALRARALNKAYGSVVALDGVDLEVPPGQVHGLVGPNGAGKTTLLGMLLGLTTPDTGTLELLGHPVRRSRDLPDGVAGFVDGPGLYPSLTARQNLVAMASLRGERPRQVDLALDRVGLDDVADDRVRGFSLGMRQRLGLAAALLGRPQLLVLDEPMNGLDPAAARRVHQLLAELAAEGTAVVVSSHRTAELGAVCGAVTLLSAGRVVFTGPVSRLAAQAGPLDHRLRTTDVVLARRSAAVTPGLVVVDDGATSGTNGGDVVVVRGDAAALDALIGRLVAERVGVRELAPVIPPLEAAFLALAGALPQHDSAVRA